jgi:arsenate reductase
MAEAISKILAADVFKAFSAGTEIKPEINPDAVTAIWTRYHVDMRSTQRPKLLDELPAVDVVVTMGCGVTCPYIPARHREDWDLEDPTGKGLDAFLMTSDRITQKVTELKNRLTRWPIVLKGDSSHGI